MSIQLSPTRIDVPTTTGPLYGRASLTEKLETKSIEYMRVERASVAQRGTARPRLTVTFEH